MDKTKGTGARQWHPAFLAGLQIEFEEEKGKLNFENEHQLSRKPLGIDALIVKGQGQYPVKKNIGRIFRRYNIVEYKGPTDYLSIDDFYKVFGYACLYKADTGGVDEIKFGDITITFFCHKYPRKLIRHLRKFCHYEVGQREEGIYQVRGERIPIQIILTSRLSEENNLWLRCLGNPVKDAGVAQRLMEIYAKNRKDSLYEAVMDMIVRTNKDLFKEAGDMGSALVELMEEIMGDEFKAREREMEKRVREETEKRVRAETEKKVRAETEKKVRAETEKRIREETEKKVREETEKKIRDEMEKKVREEWKAESKAENILELLEECGDISKELRMRIMSERNLDVLKRWNKLAARTTSVDEFRQAM